MDHVHVAFFEVVGHGYVSEVHKAIVELNSLHNHIIRNLHRIPIIRLLIEKHPVLNIKLLLYLWIIFTILNKFKNEHYIPEPQTRIGNIHRWKASPLSRIRNIKLGFLHLEKNLQYWAIWQCGTFFPTPLDLVARIFPVFRIYSRAHQGIISVVSYLWGSWWRWTF